MSRVATIALGLSASGCATAPLQQAGSLESYNRLTPSDGVLTRSLLHVSKEDVLAARKVRIVPATFSASAANIPLSPAQRSLVSNAIDRSLCVGLSERFEVVASADPADLAVHATVTHIAPTDPTAAGVSKVASVAPSFLLPGVPVPVPRLPIGLGSLSIEAEARDPRGRQSAAMVWGRGANSLTSSPRVAEEGDAYDLAADFGADFSKLLVTGETPFGKLSAPSAENITARLGGKPKYAACEAFGRSPGVVGLIGERMGLPPDWTDKGAAAPRE